jgi:anaerobic ribonucleoside-triphosphate reductase activating protein
MKYVDTKIVMQEVPDEITLAINISNCPCHCKGCHSPYLAEDIGEDLSIERLTQLSTEAEGITCISFMGGDADPKRINRLAKWVKEELDLNVCWYSGRDEISDGINLANFDYIKIGHYDEEAGPLYKPTTNQRMYKVSRFFVNPVLVDITDRFWNED